MSHTLLIPSWYAGTYDPNNGSYVREQALALKEFGHKVGIVYNNKVYWYYIKNHKKIPKCYLSHHFDNDMPVYYTDTLQLPNSRYKIWNRLSSFLNRFRNNKKLLSLVRRYIKKHGKPDIIHAHSFYPGDALPLISKKFNIPYIITEHWSGFANRTRRSQRIKLIRDAYSQASEVIAVSSSLAECIKSTVGRDSVLIPNCIKFNQFRIKHQKAPVFTFCAVGYFHPIKRYDLLIHAFQKAFSGIADVKLILVGDGTLKSQLMQLVSQLQLNGRVEFPGRLSRIQVADVIASSHVLASSSDYETFGMTLIEALACGTPVVALRKGGPISIIDRPEFGVLAEDTLESLADAMLYVYKNYGQFKPDQIRSLANSRFSEEAVIAQINAVYNKVITFHSGTACAVSNP